MGMRTELGLVDWGGGVGETHTSLPACEAPHSARLGPGWEIKWAGEGVRELNFPLAFQVLMKAHWPR